jgi:hypothetical protein
MHDPMTVAFELPGLTIWHVDPEKRGKDDSCDWWGTHRPLNPRERALSDAVWNLEPMLDNRPHYPNSREHLAFQGVKVALHAWRKRGLRLPARWHIWHWRIQIHWLLDFKRWAFSRCATCGGRFAWGYCPRTDAWNGVGPRWFRGEPHTYHSHCPSQSNKPSQAEPKP